MEKRKVLLAFDLGTSGVKCSVFDTKAKHLVSAYGEYATYFPKEGFQEQKPAEWVEAIRRSLTEMKEILSESKVCAIGVSGHSLGVIPVDEKGTLLSPSVPIWSDARAKKEADAFFEKYDYNTWYNQTGNGFPAHLYGLFKVLWYQKNDPSLYEKTDVFLGSKDYINLCLTGKAATDHSYASGSGLYNLREKRYMEDVAAIAGVDVQKFPPIFLSHQIIGTVTERAAEFFGLEAGIPVVAGGVDNACMTLGAGCFEEGKSYASLGSSAWVTVCAKDPLTERESGVYTFAHCVEDMFIPSVGIFSSGSALEWVRRNMFSELQGNDRFQKMEEMAKGSEVGAKGIFFVPCLAGGASVDPSPNTKGAFFGLSLAHQKEDLARAAFEGIATHLYAASEKMIIEKRILQPLLLVGGGAKGEFARQIYADVFGISVAVSAVQQAAASLGAASLAARGCGEWKDYSPLKELFEGVLEYMPNGENHQKYKAAFPIWKELRSASAKMGELLEKMKTR